MSIGDLSGRMKRVKFGTGPNGYAGAEFAIDCDLTEAFFLASYLPGRRLTLGGGGGTAWDGRIEDVTIDGNGITARALGYWAALYDVPYTAAWVQSDVSKAEQANESLDAFAPKMYQMDSDNRLFVGLQKGAVYPTGTSSGAWYFIAPDDTARSFTRAEFSYSVTLPTGWTARLSARNASFGSAVSLWTLAGTGASASGTANVNFSGSPRDVVLFEIYNNSGSNYTYSGESGASGATFTNIYLTSSGSVVYASEIAAGLASYVNGINSGQLSSGSTLIQSPGVELTQEVYEDEYPGDILKRLAEYGDNLTPPRRWEVGVYDSQQLYFRPRGSAGRAWYVDAAHLRVDFTIASLRNSAYGVYRTAGGRTMRTAVSTDSASVSAFNGITRRAPVKLDSTSSTQATTARDAIIQDGKTPAPRAEIVFSELYDGAGARYPLYTVRSGDTITIRNLPANVSTVIDRLRTFLVIETEYDADSDTIRVVPEDYLPALAVTGRTRAQDRGRG